MLIEEKLGKSIEDIFSIYGEERFRDEETKIILELVLKEEEPVVVALGGGAVVRDVNRKILFQSNRVKLINLRAGPRELYRRLKNKEDRPLLKQGNPYTVIKDLLEARKNFTTQYLVRSIPRLTLRKLWSKYVTYSLDNI